MRTSERTSPTLALQTDGLAIGHTHLGSYANDYTVHALNITIPHCRMPLMSHPKSKTDCLLSITARESRITCAVVLNVVDPFCGVRCGARSAGGSLRSAAAGGGVERHAQGARWATVLTYEPKEALTRSPVSSTTDRSTSGAAYQLSPMYISLEDPRCNRALVEYSLEPFVGFDRAESKTGAGVEAAVQ
eukprot:1319290-Pyramimonas_sp.AAC.1